jgi:hypothetical protein
MSMLGSSQVAQVAQTPTALWQWRVAIIASIVLWLAMFAGNIALYGVHPAGHWPVLEGVETLQAASLIPIALILHRLNRGASLSLIITILGIGAMVAIGAIGVEFATELVAFSKGPIGGIVYYISWLVMLGWLFSANAVAWSRHTLPRRVALLGMAMAVTATLLYPVWALRLLRALSTNVMDWQHV